MRPSLRCRRLQAIPRLLKFRIVICAGFGAAIPPPLPLDLIRGRGFSDPDPDQIRATQNRATQNRAT